MTFSDAVKTCFNKYATFQERAARSEFWYFALFQFIANLVLGYVDAFFLFGAGGDISVLSSLFGLAVFIPSISVAVRRLHDIDRSGWWWWLLIIPLIGWIILIIWYATKGTDGRNRFGADPLASDDEFEDIGLSHKSSIPHVSRGDDS